MYCLHIRSYSGPVNVLVIGDNEEKRIRHKRTLSDTTTCKMPRVDTVAADETVNISTVAADETVNISTNDPVTVDDNVTVDTTKQTESVTYHSEVINELIKSHS